MGRKIRIRTELLPHLSESSKQLMLDSKLRASDKAEFICPECGKVKVATIAGYVPGSLCMSCAAKARARSVLINNFLEMSGVHPDDRELIRNGDKIDFARVWCKNCNEYNYRGIIENDVCPKCGR